MRLRLWFVVSTVLFLLTHPGVAQDSLTFNTTPLTLAPSTVIDASTALKWRLSGTVGYHQLFQQASIDKSLYLTNGLQATLAADYFFSRNVGLGFLMGYQNLVVSDAFKRDPAIPRLDLYTPSSFFPIINFHSFMLAVGPAFSVPISQRLTVDVDLRVGGYFNDPPVIKAYFANPALLTTTPSLTIIPSDQGLRLGFTGSVGLKYQFTQQFGLGIAANANYTSFDYTQIKDKDYTQNHVDLRTYGVQATVSYRFLSSSRQRAATATGATATAAIVTPKPVCYAPIVDPTQQSEYEVGSPRRPVIRWRSSAPVYTEGEQYVFRLYTLPGNKLLHEQTVRETQIAWPAQLALPDTASYYFYSLYTSRSDDAEQTCRSEPVVGTLGFFNAQSPVSAQAVAPREPTVAFTFKLYALQPTLIWQKAPAKTALPKPTKRLPTTGGSARNRPTKSAKPVVPAIQVAQVDSSRSRGIPPDSIRSASAAGDSTRIRLAAADSTRSDSLITSMRIVPTLLYEEPIPQASFSWSGKVPLPDRPTVYQYVIVRNSSHESIQNHYVMIEPDGCHSIITEAVKNKYLRESIPPTMKPVPESALPTTKETPK